MMLLSVGVPEIPAGGSFCSRLKSLMRRFRAGVDMTARAWGGSSSDAARRNNDGTRAEVDLLEASARARRALRSAVHSWQ